MIPWRELSGALVLIMMFEAVNEMLGLINYLTG